MNELSATRVRQYERLLSQRGFGLFSYNVHFKCYRKQLSDRCLGVDINFDADAGNWVSVLVPGRYSVAVFNTVEELELALLYQSLRPLSARGP